MFIKEPQIKLDRQAPCPFQTSTNMTLSVCECCIDVIYPFNISGYIILLWEVLHITVFILYVDPQIIVTFVQYCFHYFSFSIEKVSKIPSPVLIIHGTEDEVIDFSHGLALFERCPKAVEPLWVEGAGHNDIELYSQYLERLRRFINQDLAAQHA